MADKPQDVKVNITRLFRLTGGKSSLKAFVNIEIMVGSYVIGQDGFKVIEGQDGPWVGKPSSTYTDKKGKTQYSDTCFFSQNLEYVINDAILEAYNNPDFQAIKSLKPQKKVLQPAGTTTNNGASSGSGISEEDIPF